MQLPWKDRCYLASPDALRDEVEYFRKTIADGDVPFHVHPNKEHGDTHSVEAAMYGLFVIQCFCDYWLAGDHDFAIQAAVEVGEIKGDIQARAQRVYVQKGRKMYDQNRKPRRREPQHDYTVLYETYLAVRPTCSTEAEAYGRVRSELGSSVSDPTIRKAIKCGGETKA